MKLPDLRYAWRKLKRDTLAIRGINYSDNFADGDLADSAGLSTRRYPYFSTLHGRPAVEGYEGVTAIYRYKDGIFTVVGEKLFWNGTELCQVMSVESAGQKQFVTINTKVVLFPDKLQIDMTTDPPTVKDMAITFVTQGSLTEYTQNSITIPAVAQVGGERYHYFDTGSGTMKGWYLRVYDQLGWENGEYTHLNDYRWSEIAWTNTEEQTARPPIAVGDKLMPKIEFDEHGEIESVRLQYTIVNDYRNAPTEASADDPAEGYYAVVTSVLNNIAPSITSANRMGGLRIYYTLHKFGSFNPKLKDYFSAGDAVEIKWATADTDNPLAINDTDGIAVKSVSQNTLTFNDNSFIVCSSYGKISEMPSATPCLPKGNQQSDGYYGFYSSTVSNIKYIGTKNAGGQTEYIIPITVGQYIVIDASGVGDPAAWLLNTDGQKYQLPWQTVATPGTSYSVVDNYRTITAELRITVKRKVPDMDYICEKDNRLWGVVNHQNNRVWDADAHKWKTFESRLIVASSLGMPDDFYDYNGAYSGAYAVAVASEGDFTGIAPYGDSVLAWKEKKLCKVMGDYPANYSLHEYTVDGLQAGAHGTQVNISETLLYKGVNGVHAYAGGTPRLISASFGERRYTAEAAGTDGERYFITLTDADGAHHLHSYDVQRGLWLREGNENAVGYVDIPAGFSALLDDGTLRLMDSGEDDADLDWLAQFTPFYETIDVKKRYSKLILRLELGTGAHVRIMERVDGRPWKQIGMITGNVRNIVTVPVPIARGDKMEIMLTGHGACTILGIQRQFSIGSEV